MSIKSNRLRRSFFLAPAIVSIVFGLGAQATRANPSAAGSAKPHDAKPYDFNGDGRQDMVTESRGLIVVNGTPNGLATRGKLLTPPGSTRLDGAVTSADFNRDGYADVAAVDSNQNAIFVLPGSKHGLTTAGSYKVTPPNSNEFFDGAVKAADLNDDGWSDLIAQTGVPATPGPVQHLTVMYGGSAGVTTDSSYQIASPDPSLAGFGDELAIGLVDGDRLPDLVVGSSGNRNEDDGNTAGGTWYCPGGPTGPTTCTKIGGTTGGVAIGQVAGGKHPDVISADAGVATVYRGTAAGLADGVTTTFASGRTTRHPFWPSPITIAKLNDDKYDDVVLGDIWWHHMSGRIAVLNGGRSGLSARHRHVISQATKGVPGAVHHSAHAEGAPFGWSVSALNVNGRGRTDLLVGAPDGPTHASAQGEVYYFAGTRHGPSTPAQQLLGSHLKGIAGTSVGFGAPIGVPGASSG